MNNITYKYTVSLQLLEKIEDFVEKENPTVEQLKFHFRRLKLFYRHGLAFRDINR